MHYKFNEIVGQKNVISRIKDSFKRNELSHAYIFLGSEGIGKRTLARILSALILCSYPSENGACGECSSCLLIKSDSHPEFHCINPVGSTIGIDEIRKMQKSGVSTSIYRDKKVYLVEQADRMTVQAQNCMLKMLEEPGRDTVIILTLVNLQAMLDTIKSRCITFRFSRNSKREIEEFICSKYAEINKLNFVTAYADGIIGRAIQVVESEEVKKTRENAIEISMKLMECMPVEIFKICDFFEANKQNVGVILDIMEMFYRDVLFAKTIGANTDFINNDKRDIIMLFQKKFSLEQIVSNLEYIEQTKKNINFNVNFRINIQNMLIRIMGELHS